MVFVQTNGPIDTKGSLEVSGKTEIDGNVCPREEAEVESCEVGVAVKLVILFDVAWRALTLPVLDEEERPVPEVKAGAELDEKVDVVANDKMPSGIDVGIPTGQKDQTVLPSSQYKSISNRRNPEARRFEKQSPELSSSYRRFGKHAAEKDTPGVVT